jgi:hypothetical protein
LALFPRATSAYSLAKKKRGTNASMATPSTRFSTAKGRMRKMSTFIRGDATRCSTSAKATSSMAPAAMQTTVPTLAHPQIPACWKPTMLKATPLTMVR